MFMLTKNIKKAHKEIDKQVEEAMKMRSGGGMGMSSINEKLQKAAMLLRGNGAKKMEGK